MIRLLTSCLAIPILAIAAEPNRVTWTGWFSDQQCPSARAASDTFTPTNPDCARKCIENGAEPVFISEQAKAIYRIRDYPTAVNDLGWRLELTGTVDESAKTISALSVKRLSPAVLSCTLPKKAKN